MVFNPEESIDFHGFTGTFLQYTYARIQSVLKKARIMDIEQWSKNEWQLTEKLLPLERTLIIFIEKYPSAIGQAAEELNPSVIALYVFNLAKTFNSFYTEHSIASAENEEKKHLRLYLSVFTANVIKSALGLLGMHVPERM